MMNKLKGLNYKFILVSIGLISMTSCYDRKQKASADNTSDSPGIEYAPQMYHAESYEPLSQVVDKEAGLNHWPYEKVGGGVSDFDTTLAGGHGEWFNTNYYNVHGMNMRQPVAGTIARGKSDFKYNIDKDSIATWAALKSPVEGDAQAILDGALLYERNCKHCHGENGDGKGPVGVIYGGVPNYHSKAYRAKARGDIYNTITFGRNSMRPHAAQVDPLDRWKIAEYIKDWQVKVEIEQGN